MTDRDAFLEYVRGLKTHDTSLAVALRELLRRTAEDGVAPRERWIEALRETYHRRDTSPGVGETSEQQAGETLGRYLEEQVIARIERRNIAHRRPGGAAWERIEWSPDLWTEISQDRHGVQEALDRSVEEIRALAREREGGPARGGEGGVSGSLLEGRSLTKIYQGRRVVNSVDIDVRQGEIVGLLGPNGAGKTTTFYMIVGLIPPDEGRVFLDDREITKVPMYRRARMGVGYLAQEPSVFRKLTVEENVLAILETMGLAKKEKEKRLEELLRELSIEHLRKSKAYSLSGGERRRLEITRALVQDPKFMLLDEPFAGIDPIAVNDIQQIVAELKFRRIGVIISDHNVEQTLDIVDRAYIMYEGRIRVSGSVSELVWNDDVAEIYLGPTLTSRMRQRYPVPVSTP